MHIRVPFSYTGTLVLMHFFVLSGDEKLLLENGVEIYESSEVVKMKIIVSKHT